MADLRRVSSRALRAASRARAASMHLPMMRRATVVCLSKYSPSFSLTSCSTCAFDVAVELALGLPFELRLRQLHRYHGDQAFAHVVAGDGDFVFLLLEHARGAGEIIDGAGQRGAKAGKVRAAIDGVDGVGEGKDVFRVAVVVLQRDFHFHVVALALDGDGRIVQHLLAAIEMLDELDDAAGEAKLGGFVAALVLQRDLQALVQKGQLAQPLRQQVVAEDGRLEKCCRRDGR